MSRISDDDMSYIVGELKDELGQLSTSRYRQVTRSEDSFIGWIRNQVYDIARSIGLIISAPFRAIWDAIRGLFDGLFG